MRLEYNTLSTQSEQPRRPLSVCCSGYNYDAANSLTLAHPLFPSLSRCTLEAHTRTPIYIYVHVLFYVGVFILIHIMGYFQSWRLLLSNNNSSSLTNQPTHSSTVGSVRLVGLVIDHPVGPTSWSCLRPQSTLSEWTPQPSALIRSVSYALLQLSALSE